VFCALLPVVSPLAGVLLTIPAYQMLRAHATPVFPSGRGIALGNPLIFDVVLARFGRDRF